LQEKETIMTIPLSEEQRQTIERTPAEPLTLVDAVSNTAYVLLRADLYERLKAALDEDLSAEQVGILVERAMREYDEADPLLEGYQHYRNTP
jgi:hypothetical protein